MLATPLTGRRFERLTVVGQTKAKGGRGMVLHWVCRCDCGAEVLARTSDLTRGAVKSCGCLWKETITTHGRSRSPEYAVWQTMRARCSNPNHAEYPRYGARGVTVCDRWDESFDAFHEDMGDRPSPQHQIDRVDGTKGYGPDNCRWATPRENTNNRVNTVVVEHEGLSLPLSEWADRVGLPYDVVYARVVRYHWPVSRALTLPIQPHTGRQPNVGTQPTQG